MTFQESEYHPYDFANRRHIGPSPSEIAEMLRAVGAASLDALIDETVPAGIRQAAPLGFGPALSEQAALHRLRLHRGEEPGADQPDRAGLLRHGDAAGDPAEHPGESGLVHRLYARISRRSARGGSRPC